MPLFAPVSANWSQIGSNLVAAGGPTSLGFSSIPASYKSLYLEIVGLKNNGGAASMTITMGNSSGTTAIFSTTTTYGSSDYIYAAAELELANGIAHKAHIVSAKGSSAYNSGAYNAPSLPGTPEGGSFSVVSTIQVQSMGIVVAGQPFADGVGYAALWGR